MSDYLTFGELKEGDRFISVPRAGDNSGHGGFKRSQYVFMKIAGAGENNKIRQKDGVLSHAPNSMPVFKVE